MNFLKTKLTGGLWSSGPKEDPSTIKIENPDGTATDAKDDETINKEHRNSLWNALSSKMGMDITVGVTLPIWFMEPVSVLQRICEMLHFANLLNEAAGFENSLDRIAYVAIFAVTGYNGTERYGKPFNPILGETFEFEDKENGLRVIAEQLSHHPPIAALHSESQNFIYWHDSRPKTKFLGNSVDLDTSPKVHIYFPKTRDHFVFSPPTTRVNNLIIGRTWIDHFGVLTLTNLKNGETCVLNFEKCGWLGRGRHEVSGYVKDANGKDSLYISGKWSESMNVKWLYENGKEPKDTSLTVWSRPKNNAIGKHKLTEYCMKLNALDEEYEKLLPPTDSRLRPDRRALEKDTSLAGNAKSLLEDRQRADKKNRTTKNEEWKPRWFKEIPEENGNGNIWVYCGDYWEQRQKKIELLAREAELKSQEKPDAAELEQIQEQKAQLLGASAVRGLACDFSSYKQ